VGRVAGNFEDDSMLASFEFGTRVAGAKLIVVLGHTSCGAVKGAADGVELGRLTELLDTIEPALEQARAETQPPYDSSNGDYIEAATEANVRRTMADLVEESPVIAELVTAGDLAVVGGVYDLATGRVAWLD
jgi:carbonic anhydrase